MDKKKGKADVTNAQTDTESGAEGLETAEDKARHISALKALYERGLINEAEYQKRLENADKTT